MPQRALRFHLASPALLVGSAAFATPVFINSDVIIQPGATEILGVPMADADVFVQSGTLTMNGRQRIRSLYVLGGRVTHSQGFRSGELRGLWLEVTEDCLLTGGTIDVSGKGYLTGEGPGSGAPGSGVPPFGTPAGGGSHGGLGGCGAGVTYDSAERPVDFGSAGGTYANGGPPGPGVSGGGALRLNVGGALYVQTGIYANGSDGGGAGGSILVQAGSIRGPGLLAARGGACVGAVVQCGGGGGRIAVYCCDSTLTTQQLEVLPWLSGNTSGECQLPARFGHSGTVFGGSVSVTIQADPSGATVRSGETIGLAVAATTTQSGGELTYQWRRNGITLTDGDFGGRATGTHSAVFTLVNAQVADAGRFDVLVSDACGPFPSGPAAIYVACNVADVAGVGGAPSPPDGRLTGDDFISFINAFVADDWLADITGVGGPPALPDGLITGDDFNAFIAAFASGCP